YIKNNFAKHRKYYGLDSWNEEGWKWLERTGNHKEHNTTKKRPADVFAIEKQHLRPISSPIEGYFDNNNSSITRTVRKDNTIWYKSNRYSVPLGTFNQINSVFIKVTDNTQLLIIVPETGELLAKHFIETTKGNLIQDSNHVRNRTVGIDAYITKVAEKFTEKETAINYLNEIRKLRSRYIRDQLQSIHKQTSNYTQEVIDLNTADE
ncbi:MAG TPA: IS21 family transposase, partial [Alloiococcus sp.]|nr:IS21 family transposase [Alloiococcus sp.]